VLDISVFGAYLQKQRFLGRRTELKKMSEHFEHKNDQADHRQIFFGLCCGCKRERNDVVSKWWIGLLLLAYMIVGVAGEASARRDDKERGRRVKSRRVAMVKHTRTRRVRGKRWKRTRRRLSLRCQKMSSKKRRRRCLKRLGVRVKRWHRLHWRRVAVKKKGVSTKSAPPSKVLSAPTKRTMDLKPRLRAANTSETDAAARLNKQMGMALPKDLPVRYDEDHKVRTLQELFTIVKRSNLDLRILRQQAVQAELARAKAWAILKPRLSVSLSYTRNDNETKLLESVLTPRDQLGMRVQLQWAFFNVQAIPLLNMANLGTLQVAHAAKQAKREVMFGLTRAYYGVLLTEGLLDIARRTWDNSKKHLKIARARFQAGLGPQLLVTRALLDQAKAYQQWTEAENALRNAKLALSLLLNRSNFKFRTKRPQTPTPPTGNRKIWIRQALQKRQEVKSARIAVQMAEAQVTQSMLKFVPTVAAIGTLQGQNAEGFVGRNFTWSAGLAMQIDVYSGGTRFIEVKEARSKLFQARLKLAKSLRQIRNDIAKADIDLKNAKTAVLIARGQSLLARRSYALTQAQYKAGVSTAVEVSDALNLYRTALISVLQKELNYDVAIVALQRAIGAYNP
tara:strand:+ start:32523 stop:34388 length:1866 start_codon:yes stop_codon:yes gene_type:complete